MITNTISAQDFTDDEKKMLETYVSANVPYTVLQRVYILTEKSLDKADVFTTCWRILNSCMNYCTEEVTKNKIKGLLAETEDVYKRLYEYLKRLDNITIIFKTRIQMKIKDTFTGDDNLRVNNLIDVFMVITEKIQVMDLDKIVGLDQETDEGKKVYEEISKSVEETKSVEDDVDPFVAEEI